MTPIIMVGRDMQASQREPTLPSQDLGPHPPHLQPPLPTISIIIYSTRPPTIGGQIICFIWFKRRLPGAIVLSIGTSPERLYCLAFIVSLIFQFGCCCCLFFAPPTSITRKLGPERRQISHKSWPEEARRMAVPRRKLNSIILASRQDDNGE